MRLGVDSPLVRNGNVLKWRDRYQVISKEAEQAHLELSDTEAARREIKRLERRLAEVEEERENWKTRCYS